MSKKDRPNPLPCGCAVFGIQKIDPFTEKISYENMYVKHCDMHTNAAVKLERLRAVVEAAKDVSMSFYRSAEFVMLDNSPCWCGRTEKHTFMCDRMRKEYDALAAALERVKEEER